jgi:23S rRNA (cytidine1920-2'-O)/16S rRNA (cytidine1409-2'-O)-methyltransferase
MKKHLYQILYARGLTPTASQAESVIQLGRVTVNGKVITRPDYLVNPADQITLQAGEQYVSRAALKLASVSDTLKIAYAGKVVLDVGSSTGGFTDYALRHGARKVIAVEVGKNQLHPSLRTDARIELHEQTDIRDITVLSDVPDVVVIDVSFISLKEILPHVRRLSTPGTTVVAMVKPQFEASPDQLHKGIIKNDRIRRDILQAFEQWVRGLFVIVDKADSTVAGSKGNVERFYKLQPLT